MILLGPLGVTLAVFVAAILAALFLRATDDLLRRPALTAPERTPFAGGEAPVFAVAGLGAREQVQDLRLDHAVRLVDTTRAASILLIAGTIPDALAQPLARLHDSLPHPRCTVWWSLGAPSGQWLASFPRSVAIEGRVQERLTVIQRELLSGQRPSEPPILPDVDPAPWRGVGPYGQGGTGMTGGTPYGRPMAELGPDRDGLRLDLLPLKVGPFFPRFPAGLTLEVRIARCASSRPESSWTTSQG